MAFTYLFSVYYSGQNYKGPTIQRFIKMSAILSVSKLYDDKLQQVDVKLKNSRLSVQAAWVRKVN